MIELKEEKDKSTITDGDFNAPLSAINRSTKLNRKPVTI
jgi:hypothetical protein